MTTTTGKRFAPYSRVKPVTETIRRLREKGLPDPTTSTTLKYVGIAEGLAYQAIRALEFLGLIDSEGGHTEAFERLRIAPDDEYQAVLADIIRAAYQPVFAYVDPATDDIKKIENAFRQYEPQGQWDRMVYLFLGLCREAGIMPKLGPKQSKSQLRRTASARKNGSIPRSQYRTEDQAPEPQTPTNVPNSSSAEDDALAVRWREVPSLKRTYTVIAGLVDQLPTDGRWTQERRDRWVRAMEAAIDLLVEVVPAES